MLGIGLTNAPPGGAGYVVPTSLPANFGTVQWWLRADAGITLNAVSQWQDARGGSTPIFAQSTVSAQPTYNASNANLNYQPSVDFINPTFHQEMDQTAPLSIDPSQPYWMVIVGYDTNFTAEQGWVGDLNNNAWYLSSFWPPATGVPPNLFGSSTGVVNALQALSPTDTGQSVIYMAEFNDPLSSTIRINSDTPAALLASPAQTPPTNNSGTLATMPQLRLGGTFGSALTLNGSIGFFVAGHGTLTDAQRRSLQTYLSQRFGIAVSGTQGTPLYPTSIPGINIDVILDPAVTASITASVSTWADQSKSGDANRNATQATKNAQPIRIPGASNANGQPSVSFTISPFTFMTMAGLWSNAPVVQPYTIVIVGNDGNSGTQAFVGDAGAGNWRLVAYTSKYGASVGATVVGTTADSTSVKCVIVGYSDPNSNIYVSEVTSEATGNIIGSNLPQLELGGANGGSSAPLNGAIYEVIVFTGTVNIAGFLKNYIAPRYNLAIGA